MSNIKVHNLLLTVETQLFLFFIYSVNRYRSGFFHQHATAWCLYYNRYVIKYQSSNELHSIVSKFSKYTI